MELKNKTVKCRKQHDCNWCGEKIAEGDQAQYRSGLWEGGYLTDYLHPECWEAIVGSIIPFGIFFPHEQERGKTFEESHAGELA